MRDLADAHPLELASVVAEHLLERPVRLDETGVDPCDRDADRDRLHDRPEEPVVTRPRHAVALAPLQACHIIHIGLWLGVLSGCGFARQ